MKLGYIKIISADSSLKWYANKIDQVIPFTGIVSGINGDIEYRCNEDSGYVNFVSGCDAIDITDIDVGFDENDFIEEEMTMTKSNLDRFDLEQQIMTCWSVVDDIDAVYNYVGDHEDFIGMDPNHADKIANLLLGIKCMYDVKFDNMFRTFETLISEKKIK